MPSKKLGNLHLYSITSQTKSSREIPRYNGHSEKSRFFPRVFCARAKKCDARAKKADCRFKLYCQVLCPFGIAEFYAIVSHLGRKTRRCQPQTLDPFTHVFFLYSRGRRESNIRRGLMSRTIVLAGLVAKVCRI